jgi:uncharacterized membrane protein YfcA
MDFAVLWLVLLAFLAGLVDAVAGGGGLIQVPALLVFLPAEVSANVATVLGTNKLASIFGTGAAVARYAPQVRISWHSILPTAIVAFVASYLGALSVSALEREIAERVVLVMLVGVTVYALWQRDLGSVHAPAFTRHCERSLGLVVGAVLGFYDGFFGPGVGSFLVFTFIGVFGFDFLRATASAKVINFATNLSSLLLFAATGHVAYRYGLPMAAFQIAGSVVGTRLAISRGNRFVRVMFLGVAAALIGRFGVGRL